MPQSLFRARQVLERITEKRTIAKLASGMAERIKRLEPLPPRIPAGNDFTERGLQKRREFLESREYTITALKGEADVPGPCELQGSIENQIGFCQVPVGVIGPLRINGLYAQGDFYIPLATTEGALVASYHRGAYVISQSGGATAICLTESVMRAPCFVFANLIEAGMFLEWVTENAGKFEAIISDKTRHGHLVDIQTVFNGTTVYLICEYTTGDAAGQNMVTIATEAICRYIIESAPVTPRSWYLEGNMSGDKKASMLSFIMTRGKKVIAEADIAARVVERVLHTTPAKMAEYCKISTQGGIQSGTIGVQGHFANALAALFIACGQDAACVAEASVGITDMEVTEHGSLHITVSLPNLTVGTVGGGTYLPTARECLELMGCYGEGTARKFAEICAVTVMAGELSIIGALAAGEFGQAHATHRHKAEHGTD